MEIADLKPISTRTIPACSSARCLSKIHIERTRMANARDNGKSNLVVV
jgi:hypothetical protein